MLTTLLRPTSGVVELDGLDLVAKRDGVRERFVVAFDAPALAGVAVLLLAFGAWRFSKIEIQAALQLHP